jgi:hypothetical protein
LIPIPAGTRTWAPFTNTSEMGVDVLGQRLKRFGLQASGAGEPQKVCRCCHDRAVAPVARCAVLRDEELPPAVDDEELPANGSRSWVGAWAVLGEFWGQSLGSVGVEPRELLVGHVEGVGGFGRGTDDQPEDVVVGVVEELADRAGIDQ